MTDYSTAKQILTRDKDSWPIIVNEKSWTEGWPKDPGEDWRQKFFEFLYGGENWNNEEHHYNILFDNKKGIGHAVGACTCDSVFYFFDPMYGEMCLPIRGNVDATVHAWAKHEEFKTYFKKNSGERDKGEGYFGVTRYLPCVPPQPVQANDVDDIFGTFELKHWK